MRITVLILLLTLLFPSTVFSNETGGYHEHEAVVSIDGAETDALIVISEDGEISIKLGDFAAVLGYSLIWNEEKRHVEMRKDDSLVIVRVDENKCVRNGSLIYVNSPAYILEGRVFLPLPAIECIFEIYNVYKDAADGSIDKSRIILETLRADYAGMQELADSGSEIWRLDPVLVADNFAKTVLRIENGGYEPQKDGQSRVVYKREDGSEIHIDLYQPARKGEGGIWEVECWFDTDNTWYQVRDLSKLPPLFHNEDVIPEKIKKALGEEVGKKLARLYSSDYNVLGFESSFVDFAEIGDKIMLSCGVNVIMQNFYRDPDTAEYIKEAKQNGSKYYLTLYYEYNMAKQGNMSLLIEAGLTPDGELDTDSMEVFTVGAGSAPGEKQYMPIE